MISWVQLWKKEDLHLESKKVENATAIPSAIHVIYGDLFIENLVQEQRLGGGEGGTHTLIITKSVGYRSMTSPGRRSNSNSASSSRQHQQNQPSKRPRVSASVHHHQNHSTTMDRRRLPTTPRKLTIRPYREAPKPPSDLFRTSWDNYLRPAVQAIHQSTVVPFSLEELYGRVEDACMHKFAPELYKLLRDTVDGHVAREIQSLPTTSSTVDAFLKAVETIWHRHCTHMLRIRSIFLYLDRTYIVQGAVRPDARSFWDMGLLIFRHHFATPNSSKAAINHSRFHISSSSSSLVTSSDVQEKTVSGLLTLVDRERDGDTIDNSMLKNLLTMFTAIGTYDEVLEKAFLAATDSYYRRESDRLIVNNLDVPAYLIHAERRILEESTRAIRNLDPQTRIPLISTVERRIVSDHVVTLLDKGFSIMCDEGRKDDIKRCYAVLSRANEHMPADSDSAHELMKARLIEYVKGVGRKIVLNSEKDGEMVQSLLDLKNRLDNLVAYSFNSAENFNNAVNLAFESFVNARENKPAELIAKFIDGILRTGNKGFTEEQLESTLDKALTLFRFIDGKDVFEAFYKKDLAKRLLYDKSASLDLEKSMISKLKTECGAQFTSKLEAMFKDVDSSKDLMQSFKTHAASRERLGNGVELNVYVLEAARWPLSSGRSSVKLPQVLMDYHETYKVFYLTKHNKRNLSWQHMDGSCTVKARFPKGEKILNLSLYQTIVMMLFNDVDEMSYSNILEATGIEEAELKRILLSLACGKVRVLSKKPRGPKVETNDEFIFNKIFAHRQLRIKVNAIQMKETVEENAATTEKVFQERNYQIDAALVRIMKTRRTLQHPTLIREVIRHLRFSHKAGDIKKRIESLIEREYLERDESNAQTYHYLA